MVVILLSFTDLPKFRGSGKQMVPIKLAEWWFLKMVGLVGAFALLSAILRVMSLMSCPMATIDGMVWSRWSHSILFFGEGFHQLLEDNYLLNLGEWSVNSFWCLELSLFQAGRHPSYMGKVPIKSNQCFPYTILFQNPTWDKGWLKM